MFFQNQTSQSLPQWAVNLVEEAVQNESSVIPLIKCTEVGWFEYLACKSKKVVHAGPHLAIELQDFLQLVKEGKP